MTSGDFHIITLDVKNTHVANPDCPMRIYRAPNDQWYCLDCGLAIMHKSVECTVRIEKNEEDAGNTFG